MIINHTYKIPFAPPQNFKYTIYDESLNIGVVDYQKRVEPHLSRLANILNKDKTSRQAALTINRLNFKSCLLSIQFLMDETTLNVIVNMRSQAEEFRAKDESMICHWVSMFIEKLDYLIGDVQIFVNVGNYHSRSELK